MAVSFIETPCAFKINVRCPRPKILHLDFKSFHDCVIGNYLPQNISSQEC